jgi:Tfp pilus assembly protein PilP
MRPLLAALALAFCAGAAAAADKHAAARAVQATAPPLPFRYVGRLSQNGKVEVLLMQGDKLYSISAGQKIGDDYVVERIGDSSIAFRYLPLKLRQNLDIPGVY